MPIEFCPLQPAWGTLGEWAAALVAAVAGAAVWRLGTKANAIATSAQAVADEAGRREAHVLLLYVSADVATVLKAAEDLLAETSKYLMSEIFVMEQSFRDKVTQAAVDMNLSSIEVVLSRIHVISQPEGDCLARAIGTQRTLQRFSVHAKRAADREEHLANYAQIQELLDRLVKDLRLVDAACKRAAGI